ncbi:hypothetical protein VJI93_08200, partial [Parvimonas sp. M20]|nr:hypothetical protein [Parvimonas sp. M20]
YYKGAYSQDLNAFVEVMLPMLFGKPVTSSGAAATVIGAAVNDEATARANADSAAATRISNVEVRAGDLEGTAGTLQTAITDINGKISTRWAAQAVSPGGRAQISVYSSSNGGAGVDIIGDVTFQGKLNVGGSSGTRLQITDTKIHFDTGSVMKVSGLGFGSSNQFIEWIGPSQSSLANCTEQNGVYYVKTDGSAYFGGTLSAGTIKNAVQTTSIASNAAVDTGTVSSRGGTRTVVVGYSLYITQPLNGNNSNGQGTNSAQIILSRNGQDVATLNVSGIWERNASSQDEPSVYTESMGGSLTFTDNSGGN